MPPKEASTKPSKVSISNGNKSLKAISRKRLDTAGSKDTRSKQTDRPGPRLIEGETPEEREKRLAKRKALTLKVFQMAYDDHHARKAS